MAQDIEKLIVALEAKTNQFERALAKAGQGDDVLDEAMELLGLALDVLEDLRPGGLVEMIVPPACVACRTYVLLPVELKCVMKRPPNCMCTALAVASSNSDSTTPSPLRL